MIEPNGDRQDSSEAVNRIVAAGAPGAVGVAGIATAIVVALWFAFYFLVFLPRAMAP